MDFEIFHFISFIYFKSGKVFYKITIMENTHPPGSFCVLAEIWGNLKRRRLPLNMVYRWKEEKKPIKL